MITSFLLLIGGIFLNLVAFLFSIIDWTIPSEVSDMLAYFTQNLGYANAFFPINTLLQALTVYLTFLLAWYSIKLIQWVLNHIPYFRTEKTPILGDKSKMTFHSPTKVGELGMWRR